MRKELITHQEPKSPISEIFRKLRTNIQFMNSNKKMKTLLVTSSSPGEGKSWVTSNLAVAFAQAGKRVILVDADMRKGRQYNIFGVSPKPGLSNYLSGIGSNNLETSDSNIVNYIQNTEVENLYIITAGNVPPNPSELLVSSKMMELLDGLKEICDLIVIDGTPCDLVTDSIILSRIVDSTVVVASHKETKKDNLEAVVKNIKSVGGYIAGIVLNKIPVSSGRYYSQTYYYSANTPEADRKAVKSAKQGRRYADGSTSDINYILNNQKDSEEEDSEPETNKIQEQSEQYNHLRNYEIENTNDIPEDKIKNILSQVNDYLESDKRENSTDKGE